MIKQCAIQPQLVTIYKEICILTDVDILAAGLLYAGFDTRCQEKSNLNRNMIRYKHSLVLICQPQLHYSEI